LTHRYTLLVGGTVLSGAAGPEASAIAWAEGVVLALGTDEQALAASRGDSHRFDLRGAFVVPAGPVTLEVGGPADLDVHSVDPRQPGASGQGAIARIRGGHVVSGDLGSPIEHDLPGG
jgi:hypothetical protein